MEQTRLREEAQIRSEHAKHLRIMRQKLEVEKKQRHEDALKLRQQLEIRQVLLSQQTNAADEPLLPLLHAVSWKDVYLTEYARQNLAHSVLNHDRR